MTAMIIPSDGPVKSRRITYPMVDWPERDDRRSCYSGTKRPIAFLMVISRRSTPSSWEMTVFTITSIPETRFVPL